MKLIKIIIFKAKLRNHTHFKKLSQVKFWINIMKIKINLNITKYMNNIKNSLKK